MELQTFRPLFANLEGYILTGAITFALGAAATALALYRNYRKTLSDARIGDAEARAREIDIEAKSVEVIANSRRANAEIDYTILTNLLETLSRDAANTRKTIDEMSTNFEKRLRDSLEKHADCESRNAALEARVAILESERPK